MSVVFILLFYLSKLFITFKKFDDNYFVRLLEISLKTLRQIYGEMICDLNF